MDDSREPRTTTVSSEERSLLPPPDACVSTRRPPRVLVVDDNEQLARCLAFLLSDAGAVPLVCGSGEEALVLAERAHLDAALVDLDMPGASGDRVILGILERTPRTACFLITGAPDDPRARAVAPRVHAVLTKPFRPDRAIAELVRAGVLPHAATGGGEAGARPRADRRRSADPEGGSDRGTPRAELTREADRG